MLTANSNIKDRNYAISDHSMAEMCDREFRLFSDLIYTVLGIKMPPAKKLMLTSRLNKRLRALKLLTFEQYYNYILSPEGRKKEYHLMINAVTTNKTEFFREAAHFNVLVKKILPELIQGSRFKTNKKLYAWSAGCSTGEEPYTLAIVLADFFSNKTGDFNILATDISTKVLSAAVNAVYNNESIKPVPLNLKKKYLLRGKGTKKGVSRIVPGLREKITFQRLNFMDRDFKIKTKTKMDIIFCRNVVIYFDRETQVEFFKKLYNQLVPDGYLFIGSSETLFGINDKFVSIGPSIYKKTR